LYVSCGISSDICMVHLAFLTVIEALSIICKVER
jgi:hypothetical protein